MKLVRHPLQSGSHLSWDDDLFKTVEQVPPEPIQTIPLAEVRDSSWAALEELCGTGDQAAYRMVA